MKQSITNISIQFHGTTKGKRKVVFQSQRIDQLAGHVYLDQSQVDRFTIQALSVTREFKNVQKVQLCTNFGENDGEMTMVELFPKQRFNILSNI